MQKKISRIRQKFNNKKISSLLSEYGSLSLGLFIMYKAFSSNEALNNCSRSNSIPAIYRQTYSEKDISPLTVSETISETAESTEVQAQVAGEKVEIKELGEENKKSPDQEKSSNVKPIQNNRKQRKRAKMVTLSNLPPVRNADFNEVCEEMYETYGYLLHERPIKVT